MQLKSSNNLQGAALNEIKELLLLIGDPKKAKEQVDLLSSDVAQLKELYQKNQDEFQKLSLLKAEVDIKLAALKDEETKLNKEKSILSKKASVLNEKDMEISLIGKKLSKEKSDFESEYSLKMNGIEAMRSNAEVEKKASELAKKEAEAVKAEYEEKLSKLKAMVG